MNSKIDTGDQPFGRRRVMQSTEDFDDTEGHIRRSGDDAGERRRVLQSTEDVDDTEGHIRRSGDDAGGERRRVLQSSEDVDDTEGHIVTRTYPGVATDELDCRMPLPGEEDERKRLL